MAKLNKELPHGTISGIAGGRKYEQGGKYFDAAGNEVVESAPAETKAAPAAKGSAAAAPEVPAGTASQVAKQS